MPSKIKRTAAGDVCESLQGQLSVFAGRMKRVGCVVALYLPAFIPEPWSPPLGAAGVSGVPEWEMIQSMIWGESVPAARIAARSITTPPDGCGRDRFLMSVVISESFTFLPSLASDLIVAVDRGLVGARRAPTGPEGRPRRTCPAV